MRLVAQQGLRDLSARIVAGEAGVNQALIFYHFGTLEQLIAAAMAEATTAMVERFSEPLRGAQTFAELHAVGLALSASARADGSAALLAQVIASAQHDPAHRRILHECLAMWDGEVAAAVRRILGSRGMADAIDVEAVTSAIAASTIGMITLDGARADGPDRSALAALEGITGMVDRVLRLVPAPLARRVLRR